MPSQKSSIEDASEQLARNIAKILLDDVERIAHEMNTEELRAIPELNQDATLAAEALASNRANVKRLLTRVARGERNVTAFDSPPEAFDIGRTFARRGINVELLFLAYWYGQHKILEEFTRALEQVPNMDPKVSFGALMRYIHDSSEYGNHVIREVLHAEREERRATAQGAHAVRNERVRLILDGAPVDLRRSSELMNYELDRYHTGIVMWYEESAVEQGAFEDLILTAAKSVGERNPIIMPAGTSAVWAWIGTQTDEVVGKLKAALDATATTGVIAVGPTRQGIQGFRTTHTACLEMQRVFSGRGMGSEIAWYRDFAVSTLVGQDAQRASDFVQDTLGALADSSPRAARLRETLRIYLAEASNAPRAAERLHMHRNTVRQRIESATETLGYDPEQHRLAVELALELHHKLGL